MGQLSRKERAIYDLFVQKAKDKGYCKLAYATIAQYTRMNIETVKVCIRELEDLGLIRRELVPNESNRYWLTDAPISEEPKPVIPSVWMPEPKGYLFA